MRGMLFTRVRAIGSAFKSNACARKTFQCVYNNIMLGVWEVGFFINEMTTSSAY